MQVLEVIDRLHTQEKGSFMVHEEQDKFWLARVSGGNLRGFPLDREEWEVLCNAIQRKKTFDGLQDLKNTITKTFPYKEDIALWFPYIAALLEHKAVVKIDHSI
jgi:hypothetical protein